MSDPNAQYPEPNPFPRDPAPSNPHHGPPTHGGNGQGNNLDDRQILPHSLKSTLSRVDDGTPFNLPRANLQDLNEKHKLCAELELMGYSIENIARTLSVPEFWIQRLNRSAAYQAYKSELRKNEAYDSSFNKNEELEKVTGEAFDTIKGIMRNSDDPKVRLKAATEFLDRSMPKVTKSETDNKHSFTFNTPIMQELVMCVTQLGQLNPKDINNLSPDQMLLKLQEAIDVEQVPAQERRNPGGV